MKIAVLSDIHGNSDALRAVVNDFPSDIDELWVLGDSIGYYYQVNEVFEILNNFKIKMIMGNHEDLFLRSLSDKKIQDQYRVKYGSSLDVCTHKLEASYLEQIQVLPVTLEINPDILLSHGSPWDINEYIYPDASEKILNKFSDYKYRIFFLGHTHYPLKKEFNNKLIINPGSVGQQRNGVLGAHWGIFDLDNYEFEFKVSKYFIENLKSQVLKNDPHNDYLTHVLTREKK